MPSYQEEREEEKNPTFISFVNWGFQALLLALVTWGVTELSGVNKSVQELNVKMAVVISKTEAFDSRLERLEGRDD